MSPGEVLIRVSSLVSGINGRICLSIEQRRMPKASEIRQMALRFKEASDQLSALADKYEE